LTPTISGYTAKPVFNGILSSAGKSESRLSLTSSTNIQQNLPETEQNPVSCGSVLGRFHCILYLLHTTTGSRDSLVGIATCHGLDGPGSNPNRAEIFNVVQTIPEEPASCTMCTVSFPEVKRPESRADYPRSSACMVTPWCDSLV